MSRRLAVVVAEIRPDGRSDREKVAHLIVIDQNSGKALKMNLEGGRDWHVWRALPDVPTLLLNDEHGTETITPSNAGRTIDSDLREDR